MGLSVAGAKRAVPASEVAEWIAYLAERDRLAAEKELKHSKIDYLVAHLIWHIRALMGGSAKAGQLRDYLLHYERGGQDIDPSEPNDVRRKRVMAGLRGWLESERREREKQNVHRNADGKDRRGRKPPAPGRR